MMPRPLLASWLATWFGSLIAAASVAAQQPADSAASELEARLARLQTWLRSDDTRAQWRAVRACVQIGEAAVPALIELMEEFPSNQRSAQLATEALCQMGPKATECLPRMPEMVNEGVLSQKWLAVEVLARQGNSVSVLSGCLSHLIRSPPLPDRSALLGECFDAFLGVLAFQNFIALFPGERHAFFQAHLGAFDGGFFDRGDR